jgi:hypothetical protein
LTERSDFRTDHLAGVDYGGRKMGIDLVCAPVLHIQRLCRQCGKILDSDLRRKVKTAARLFGLKAGFGICRCGQTIFGPQGDTVNWETDDWQQVRSIIVRYRQSRR